MTHSTHRLLLAALGASLAAGCSTAGSGVDGRASDTWQAGDSSACPRRILESQVTNARDIGGQLIAGSKLTACRSFYRGGDLVALDAAGCSEFAALDVKTVIDLRQQEVQQNQPPPSCVTEQATRVLAPMPKLLPDTAENYLALFEETEAVAKVFSVLGDAANYPVYVHCVIGRDRASFVSALVLLAVGASREIVLEEFRLSAEAGVAVKPECMEAVLDEVERLGGIESYLTSCAVSASQLDTLRLRMIH